MGVEVALVADDLTGALDAAAPFAGRGLAVRVFRDAGALPAPGARPVTANAPPPIEPARGGRRGLAVLAVSTSTRHLPPAAAGAAVEVVGRRLRAWSPRLVFKKIDSTLRGPIPAEVEAALRALERRTALVCPAFPAAGRIVRGGEVFVHGEPLRATEYAHDLRAPAPADTLETLLLRLGTVRRLRAGEPFGDYPRTEFVIADAEREAHLERLAALVAERAADVLAVGSDGLAAGLASLFGGGPKWVRLGGGGGGAVLFAIGSRTGTTQEQTRRLRDAFPGVPVVEAPAGILDADTTVRAAESARIVVARVPPVPRGEPVAVVRAFAAGVRAVVDRLGGPSALTALVATGGDTVEAILDTFGVEALDVLGEFQPGIPVSRPAAAGAAFTLISKAGGFGTPDLFGEIAAEAAAEA